MLKNILCNRRNTSQRISTERMTLLNKENLPNNGSAFEGREKAYVDVDRMINEGLSGGSVHARHDTTNIEEAHDLPKEQPPTEIE